MSVCSMIANCTIERMHKNSGELLKRMKLRSCVLCIVKRDRNTSYSDGVKRLNLQPSQRQTLYSTYYAIQIPFNANKTVEIEVHGSSVKMFHRFVDEGKASIIFKAFHYQLLIYDAQPKELKRVLTAIHNICKNKTSQNKKKSVLTSNAIDIHNNSNANHSKHNRTKNKNKNKNKNKSRDQYFNKLASLKRAMDDDNRSMASMHSDAGSEMSLLSKQSLANEMTPSTKHSLRHRLLKSRNNLQLIRKHNLVQNKQKSDMKTIVALKEAEEEEEQYERMMQRRNGNHNHNHSNTNHNHNHNHNNHEDIIRSRRRRRGTASSSSNRNSNSSSSIFKTPEKEKNRRKEVGEEKRFLKNLSEYVTPESFSDGQKQVMEAVTKGDNVFITGGAGTGKSFLIHEIISLFPRHSTFPTACTGVASSQIQGMTIYSFCGIGSGMQAKNLLLKKVLKSQEAVIRIRKAKMLIIDEVSMLSGDILDKINFVLSYVRKNREVAFGGIQVIFCGDFFQLPPIFKNNHNSNKFAFESDTWLEMELNIIQLQQIFRQRSDNAFQKILNEIRIGSIGAESLRVLRAQIGKQFDESDGISPTILLTHKKKVEVLNKRELAKLASTDIMSYSCTDSVNNEVISNNNGSAFFSDLLKNMCPAPAKLQLKIGAQVILLKNLNVSQGLCNGSRGVVVDFATVKKLPIVKFLNGKQLTVQPQRWTMKVEQTSTNTMQICRKQIPLNLGWALSIHKSQGMSLDRVRISLSSVFEYGQCYVALSRACTLKGLSIMDAFDASKIKAHPKVVKFYNSLKTM